VTRIGWRAAGVFTLKGFGDSSCYRAAIVAAMKGRYMFASRRIGRRRIFLPRPTDRRIPKHPLTTTVLNIDRREAVLLRLGSVFEQCARERDACEERQIWCEVARSRVDYLRLYTSHVAERVAITGWMIRRAGWLARAGTRPEP
jgi:hypothetical protein